MENKSKYLIKNIGLLTISNFASKILVFLLVPLYTFVLTTAEYGLYDLAVSTVTLFFPVLTLNIVDAVMRFLLDKQYNNEAIISTGFRFIVSSCVLFGIVMFILNRLRLWPALNGLEPYILLYYISFSTNQFLVYVAQGLEKVKDIGIAGVISTLLTIVSNVVFLLLFKWGLIGFFFANIIAQAGSLVYLAIRINVTSYLKCLEINLELQKEMLFYSIPLIASFLGWVVNGTADKYVVSFMLGVSANGVLSVAYKIPQIINTLQGIFIQAWQISAIKEFGGEKASKFYGDIFTIINFLMCTACSVLILLTRPISNILFSNEFYIAWQYAPFLLVSTVLNSASGLLGPILSAQKNTKAMMWSAVFGAIVNIFANLLLVYLIGIQGATIATVICSWIIYVIRKKAVGEDIIIDDYKAILITWIMLCVQAVIEIYTLGYWLEVVVIAGLIMLNYKTLKSLRLFIKRNIQR